MEPGSNGAEDTAMATLGREVGRRSVERLGIGLTRLIEEASALFRWVLTMLMLLNGAAIYACIAARDSLDPALFVLLMQIFFAGAMVALLAALAGMFLTFPVAGAIRRAITHWTDVSISGALSDEALRAAQRVKRAGAVWLIATTIIALTSLALFALGILMLGERFGLVGPPAWSVSGMDIPQVAAPGDIAEISEAANALDPAGDNAASASFPPAAGEAP